MALHVGSRVTFDEGDGVTWHGVVEELVDIYYVEEEQRGTVLVKFDADGLSEHFNVDELEELP